MKKISYFVGACIAMAVCASGFAADYSGRFRKEIENGLDYKNTSNYIDGTSLSYVGSYGELGQEVLYDTDPSCKYKKFTPPAMYIRLGGGLNIPGATKKARLGGETHKSHGSWNAIIGIGWNMSSYVRTELNFQESVFRFQDLHDMDAHYHTLNGMLYFDFARRYVRSGDIIRRRTFVPFMGIGAGIGAYNFSGDNGADGFLVVAPRAELGVNFMFCDTVGLDIAYQYQMNIGHGFGWNTSRSGVDNIGNAMATIRINF